MSDAAYNSLGLVLVALMNLVGLIYVGWNARASARDARAAVAGVAEVKTLATQTERNTNSMKDALVEATRVAALMKGKADERVAGDARRDAEAAGRAEVRREIANHKLDAVVSAAVEGIAEGPVEGEVRGGSLTVESKT